jgi:hypothetical protein
VIVITQLYHAVRSGQPPHNMITHDRFSHLLC